MKHLKRKTPIVLNVFLILNACSTGPKTTKFDGDWEFLENQRGETKACLSQEAVLELRDILIRCRGSQENE